MPDWLSIYHNRLWAQEGIELERLMELLKGERTDLSVSCDSLTAASWDHSSTLNARRQRRTAGPGKHSGALHDYLKIFFYWKSKIFWREITHLYFVAEDAPRASPALGERLPLPKRLLHRARNSSRTDKSTGVLPTAATTLPPATISRLTS